MTDGVVQQVQFQLIRPDGAVIWSAVLPTYSMPEPGRQFALAVDRPDWRVAVDGGLTYDQQDGWAWIPDRPHSEIGPPWVWRYQSTGAEWVTIAQWPKDGE